MLLIFLAYLGGVLTILSPCILPVLPFVFSRAGQPFVRSVLPMLIGMALTFAAVASLAAELMQPLMSMGNQLAESAAPGGKPASPKSSFLIGIATGLLWSPCAGP